MKASNQIVPGIFSGATIEPGTFHHLVGPFCGDGIAPRASDPAKQGEPSRPYVSPDMTQTGSASEKETGSPTDAKVEEEAPTMLD